MAIVGLSFDLLSSVIVPLCKGVFVYYNDTFFEDFFHVFYDISNYCCHAFTPPFDDLCSLSFDLFDAANFRIKFH